MRWRETWPYSQFSLRRRAVGPPLNPHIFMLFRTLDNLRQKPKAVRQRVAFLTALSFTLLVGGIWTLTLPARFSGESLSQSEGTKPFAGLWTGFRDQFSNLRQQAGAIVSTMPTSTAATTTPSEMIDIATLISTSTEPTPAPTPILIGTTSASTSTTE